MQFLINNSQFWRSDGINENPPEKFELKLNDGKLELPTEVRARL
ncbi:MAG: radical SAM protein, partial [Halanaerobium sp.]